MSNAQSVARAVRVHRFGGPEVMELADAPPLSPGAGEVLLRVHAAAVTPLDTYLRSGLKVGAYTPTPPYTPGSALSGEVVALGEGVTGFAPGDRVFGQALSGSYASHATCLASRVFPLPDGVEAPAGALIAVPYRTAHHSLFDLARAQGGETVLVQGASGSVGAAAVQLARAHGLRVIASCSSFAASSVLADGAHAAIDYRDPNWPDAARAAAGERPISIIVEVAAKANLKADLSLVAPGGRIVLVGGHGETAFDPLPVIGKGLALFGVNLPNIPPQRDAQMMAEIVAGLENRTLRPRVSLTFPFDQALAAHEAVSAGKGSGGVALITV